MRILSGVHIILGFVLIFLLGSCQSIDNNQLSDDHGIVPITPNLDDRKAIESSIVAIDTHFHVPWVSDYHKDTMLPSDMERGVDALARELEEAQVGMVLIMGETSEWNSKGDPLGIKKSLRVAKELSMLERPIQAKVIGACDPNKGLDEEKMKAVRAQLEEHRGDIVAFKCFTGYYGGPMDPGYQPFYRLAVEYNLPVIFHTGLTEGNETNIADSQALAFEKVAQAYPNLRIVLAHMGFPWHMDAAVVCFRHDNVWLDLSGLYTGTSQALDEMLQSGELSTIADLTPVTNFVETLTMLGFDRVLYASDFPYVCKMSSYRKFFEAVIPKEHHSKVFRENAEGLFGINPTFTVEP